MSKVDFTTFQEKSSINMGMLEKEAIAQNMALGFTENIAKVMDKVESINLEFVSSLGAAGALSGAAKKLYDGDPSSEDVQEIKEGLGKAMVNIAVLCSYFNIEMVDVAKQAMDNTSIITMEGKIPGEADD